MQASVSSAAGFRTVWLESPPASPITFAAMYGTEIVRLEETGYTKLAFMSPRDGDFDIYTVNLDGSGLTKLTKNSIHDRFPAWSPDGRFIAFQRDSGIWRMNADGTGRVQLTTGGTYDMNPDWSPDGTRIAFERTASSNQNIWVMNADGSGETMLTTNAGADGHPTWSPDGRRIAFESNRDGGDFDIYTMNADGSEETELTANSYQDVDPAWSPDGGRIAFASDGPGNYEIHTVAVNGTGWQRLTFHADVDNSPAWSPDGRCIAFTRLQGVTWDIFVINADGSNERNVTTHWGTDTAPAWYPLPTTRRALIGAPGSDGGDDPPFGAAKPMALVGLGPDGLVEAVSVGLGPAYWSTVKVAAMTDIGTHYAGMKITANRINTVQEDRGRGLAPRVWDVSGTPRTGAVFVLLSGDSGKVSSVISSADQALGGDGAAQVVGDYVVVRGEFPAVYSDRISTGGPASEVTIDRTTGEVVEVR